MYLALCMLQTKRSEDGSRRVRVLLAAVVGIVSFRLNTYTQGSILGVFIIHFEIYLPRA